MNALQNILDRLTAMAPAVSALKAEVASLKLQVAQLQVQIDQLNGPEVQEALARINDLLVQLEGALAGQ